MKKVKHYDKMATCLFSIKNRPYKELDIFMGWFKTNDSIRFSYPYVPK